jgi:hypothetical protein
VLGVTGSIAAVLFLLLLSGAIGWIDDPVQYLFLVIYRLSLLFSSVLSLRDFVLEFWQPAVSALPPLLWILIPGVITLAGVLWVVAIRSLTNSRRFLHENE